jgi:cold shock protein
VPTGIVKFFNSERGYGFIKPDGGGEDVFVHLSAVQASGFEKLVQGMRVGFEVGPDKKTGKAKAISVRAL